MKKLSPIKVTLLITAIVVIGLIVYPAMIWAEWFKEQGVIKELTRQYPDSRFMYESPFEDYDPFDVYPVHREFRHIADASPPFFDQYLGRITSVVVFGNGPVDADAVARLAQLNYLKEVRISGGLKTNALAPFESHKSLHALSVYGAGIGDADLKYLAGHTNLKVLVLGGTKISDESMQLVAQLTNLEELDLSRTSVTDEGVPLLANLKQLSRLRLGGTQITDDTLMAFTENMELKTLGVENTKVTAEGLIRLNLILSGKKSWLTDLYAPPGAHDLEIIMRSDQFYESDIRKMHKQGMVTLVEPFPVEFFESSWDPED